MTKVATGDVPEELYRFDTVAESLSGLAAVTQQESATFNEQGFLAIRKLLSAEQVEAAKAGLLALIGGENPKFSHLELEAHAPADADTLPAEQKQNYVRRLMEFTDFDSRLKAVATHPGLLELAERIIGEEVVCFQEMALLKPPGGGREKPWHQDKAFFNLRPESPVVGVWLALDEAAPENGCMHVIPGSHRAGPVIHFKRRDWQLCDTNVEVAQDVMVPLPPGGALFFDGFLHHGTPANSSGARRRALQFHYTAKSAVWGSEEERLAVFGEEGKDVSC